MLSFLRYLLFPFTILYWLVISLRNYFYDCGLFESRSFAVRVISVGNLNVGGSGKSPMVEYLANLIQPQKKLAILSRGYGRKTTGFKEVDLTSQAEEVGDEPLQFKHKHPELTIAVCEKRVIGIEKLAASHDVIVLDDAYQHRAVKPGLNILLYDYAQVFTRQFVLPAGNLREPLSQRKRADAIVVTKTPMTLEADEMAKIKAEIKPFGHQHLFFSYLEYGALISLNGDTTLPLSDIKSNYHLFLLTGIANPKPMLEHLQHFSNNINHHRYRDHHNYSLKNIAKLAVSFSQLENDKKLIITTEKDAQRLRLPALQELLRGLPVYYLPIAARMHKSGHEQFNQIIRNYVAG